MRGLVTSSGEKAHILYMHHEGHHRGVTCIASAIKNEIAVKLTG